MLIKFSFSKPKNCEVKDKKTKDNLAEGRKKKDFLQTNNAYMKTKSIARR